MIVANASALMGSISHHGPAAVGAGAAEEKVGVAGRCVPGSVDPHGVGDAVQLAATAHAKRRPTFSMDHHVEASPDDLCSRPFPRMNTPATTA